MQEKEKIPQRIMVGIEEEESTSQFARCFRMVCNTSWQLQKQNYNQSQKQKQKRTNTVSMTDILPQGYSDCNNGESKKGHPNIVNLLSVLRADNDNDRDLCTNV